MSLKNSVPIKLLLTDDYHNVSQLLSLIYQEPALNSNYQDYEDIAIPKIAQKLSRSETRHEGLQMLKWLLDTPLGEDVLKTHAAKWMEFCNSSLKNPHQQSDAYDIISKLLKQCSKVHELDRNLVVSVLSEVFSSFSQCSQAAHLNVLKLLEVALSQYSKTCGNHRNVIEKFLIQFIDSTVTNEVIIASKCCHLLQQVGGGGEQGANFKSAWNRQFILCLDAVTSIVSELHANSGEKSIFESILSGETDQNDTKSKSNNVGPLQTSLLNILSVDLNSSNNIKNKTASQSLKLCTRLRNLLIFIQAMLVEPFQSVKRFNPGKLIQILVMTLSITQQEPIVIYSTTDLHNEILNTLSALMFSIKGNILPDINLVFKIILQTLKWTDFENTYHLQTTFRDVRIKAYEALINVLLVVQSFKIPNGEDGLEDQIISNIMKDVLPHKEILQLKISDEKKSNKKKNRKSKANKSIEKTFNKANMASSGNSDQETVEDDLAIKALKCLKMLYFVSGNFLKQHTHKIIHESLMEFIYSGKMSSELCEAICKTLLAIQRYTPSNMGSISPYCIALYSKLQSSSNFRIKELCGFALSQCMESLRGTMPPLSLPVEREAQLSQTRKRRHDSDEAIVIDDVIQESSNEECITIEVDGDINKKSKSNIEENSYTKNIDIQEENAVEIIDSSENEDSNDKIVYVSENIPHQSEDGDSDNLTNNLNTDTPVRVDSIESEKSLDSSTTLKVTENTINKEVNIENTEKLSETVEDMLSSFVDEVIVDLKK